MSNIKFEITDNYVKHEKPKTEFEIEQISEKTEPFLRNKFSFFEVVLLFNQVLFFISFHIKYSSVVEQPSMCVQVLTWLVILFFLP